MKQLASLSLVAISAFAVLTAPGCSRALAQENTSPQIDNKRVLRVSGTAVVYAKPDLATVSLGTSKTASTVREAKKSCDDLMLKVRNAVRQGGVAANDIQTVNYQIIPVAPQPRVPGSKRGWKVVHQVQINVRNVEDVGDVLDRAVTAGATDVSDVSYTIEKIAELRSKAREMATKVAREKGNHLAQLMGVRLGEVMSVTEGGYSNPGYGMYQMSSNAAFRSSYSRDSGADSVLSSGQVAVEAREDVEFSIR
jgi:uncharacterized protein